MLLAIDYRHLERFGYVLYAFGVFNLILVFILAKDVRGSARWIQFGSFQYQPSEFMKLFLVIALAKYLHDDPRSEGRTLKDLLIPGDHRRRAGAAHPEAAGSGHGQHPDADLLHHRGAHPGALAERGPVLRRRGARRRTSSTTSCSSATRRLASRPSSTPRSDILKTGWHAHHARVAIGDGGLLGTGFMKGTQNQFGFIPDQFTDFPFPVFAEEWGFVGCLVLICLYGFLTVWSIHVASQAKDRFGAVLAVGAAAIIFWHAVINMGMAAGVVPVVGVTLPLFSYGGSSMLTMLGAVSLVMNVSLRRYGGVPAPDRL